MTTAPPPYSEAPQDLKPTMEKPGFEDKASAFTSKSSMSSSTQKLVIRYKDWRARHGTLIDPETAAPIYSVEHRYRKPTFTLNTPDGREIATASSSKWNMRFEMTIAGQNIELTPRHKLGADVTYPSPAFGGQTLSWESTYRWNCVEYVCLDANAQPVARFKARSSPWKCASWGSFGEMEFTNLVATEAQRDEVVATGLAVGYKAVMNQSSAAVVVVT